MKKADQYGGLTLAYVGDAVIELLVRQKLLETGISDTGKLSALALGFVTASAQSEAFSHIESELTQTELDVYKRGRNTNPPHHPKHQTVGDYRRATGFEALMGYLQLDGQTERLKELFEKAYEKAVSELKLN